MRSDKFLNKPNQEMNDFQAAVLAREEQLRHLKCIFDLALLEDENETGESSSSPIITVNERIFLRKIHQKERETLKNDCGCSCTNNDWSNFYLLLSTSIDSNSNSNNNNETNIEDCSSKFQSLVSKTHFDGFIVFDLTKKTEIEADDNNNDTGNNNKIDDWLRIPPGIHSNIFISDSIIDIRTCRVYRNSFISRTYIGSKTVLMNCGHISTNGDININSNRNCFGRLEISVGAESGGGRPLVLTAESTMINVTQQLATITDNSKINNVLMMEHSHCGPSSIMESTVMGPDSHASAGEVHASIIGPQTNAHHQSLLIGVLWPLGRGNVAYGANVGSNHTGRLPDQECTVGEGIFWGLNCIVKFPIDLTLSPYSMIAAGTKLSPQRIGMPFSLIVESSVHCPAQQQKQQWNDIIPGWVIQHSPYTLIRNDKKYITRRKASRHAFYTGWNILRPSTIERCRVARSILQSSIEHSIPLQDVSGIGECRLTLRARDVGIKAYEDCIHLYALQGLMSWLDKTCSKKHTRTNNDEMSSFVFRAIQDEFMTKQTTTIISPVLSSTAVEWPSVPWDVNDSSNNEWEYQRNILLEEFSSKEVMKYDVAWLRLLLEKLQHLEYNFAERVAKSKRRDDVRGAATIPGYADNHVAAELDSVIIDAKKKAEETEQFVQNFLNKNC
ncbi:hypothetical protein FRACYDRAFT_234217 [Fragilariopsis cylindrus CCMP1102]|uniref:Uncharacterized protein n=1 Tax=Fragilariopsis cylindrus CCMP1102 TaxID=635003 RepID=A0A1E7FR13_9STRA|nr:hypothetical protein FRACYDRAFT_234217 [Fragilariopsis cylindrus CCMP1102]|eukprot:OEU20586.1 hypothetical protein FRACYDRAFT_234217 [Fragilariopsis cylindrus CCMP1102]